jgi:hypothetical protein
VVRQTVSKMTGNWTVAGRAPLIRLTILPAARGSPTNENRTVARPRARHRRAHDAGRGAGGLKNRIRINKSELKAGTSTDPDYFTPPATVVASKPFTEGQRNELVVVADDPQCPQHRQHQNCCGHCEIGDIFFLDFHCIASGNLSSLPLNPNAGHRPISTSPTRLVPQSHKSLSALSAPTISPLPLMLHQSAFLSPYISASYTLCI